MRAICCILAIMFCCSILHGQNLVTNSTRSPREPSLAVNPTNQLNQIVVYITDVGIGCSYTTDGGATWTNNDDVTSATTQESDPVVAFDGAGNAYCIFLRSRNASGYGEPFVFYRQKTTTGGTSWGTATIITSPTNGCDKPWLYVSQNPNSNGAYEVFAGVTSLDESGNLTTINVYHSTDGGSSFPFLATLDKSAHENGLSIATDANGTTYVAYAGLGSGKNGPVTTIYIDKISGGGSTTLISVPATQIGSAGEDGFYLNSRFVRVNSFPSISIDPPTGNIHVVWANKAASSNNPEILLEIGTNSGGTYSFTQKSITSNSTGTAEDFGPGISVHPDGIISILFYRCFTDKSDLEVHLRTYKLAGGIFSNLEDAIISKPTSLQPQFFGDYFGIASSFGNEYAAWIDTVGQHLQVYYTSRATATQTVSGFTNVSVKQIDNDQMVFGSFGRWRATQFVPYAGQQTFVLGNNSTEVLRADQLIPTQLTPAQKYNQWVTFSDVTNHQVFTIGQTTPPLTAKFATTNDATLQSVLIDNGSINGAPNFLDPWFIDYTDSYGQRNQGMTDIPHSISYGQNDIGINSVHQGIFLGLDPAHGSTNYYSVSAATTSQWTPGVVFTGWTSSPSGSATFQSPSASSTPVVFNYAGATVTANFKGRLASSTTSATSFNNQRKMVKRGSIYHLAYFSAGDIWYTSSTDEGSTWSPEQKVSSGSEGTQRLNPSINVDNYNTPYITYEAVVDGTHRALMIKQGVNGTWNLINGGEIFLASADMKPVIALTTRLIVVLQANGFNTTDPGLYYWDSYYVGKISESTASSLTRLLVGTTLPIRMATPSITNGSIILQPRCRSEQERSSRATTSMAGLLRIYPIQVFR